MSWDYELAKKFRTLHRPDGTAPVILDGEIVSPEPLKVSLYSGEVMAPPLALACVVGARGGHRDGGDSGRWRVGDKVVCCLMGQTVVILGGLEMISGTDPER